MVKKRHCVHCKFDLIHVQSLLEDDDQEEESEDEFRTASECAQRCVVLYCVVAAAHGDNKDHIVNWLKEQDLWSVTSPNEKDFLQDPTDDKKNQETWKCEGIWTLMWALNIVDELGNATDMCNLSGLTEDNYPLKDPAGFIEKYSISRTKAEILDAADLYYRYE
mgnify:CR=1 FL=1